MTERELAKEQARLFYRQIWQNRARVVVLMLLIVLLGTVGGVVAHTINPTGNLTHIFPSAFIGVILLAFSGVAIYTVLVPTFMIFGKRELIGWNRVPIAVKVLGAASVLTYVLFFLIGAIIAIVSTAIRG